MQNQHLSGDKRASNPRRGGRIATRPLLAGLLLAVVLAPCPLRAQTNTGKAAPPSNRCLLIVETSRSMQRRADSVLKTVQDLLASSLSGQLRQGDTLGLWTFNEDLYAGRFPLQTWSPQAQADITSRTLTFLRAQKCEKQPNLDKVLPVLGRVINDSPRLIVILVSSGDKQMRGTPFDDRINESYQKWHDQQQKARMPFVTVLCVKNGQLTAFTVNTPPWTVQIPRLLQETQSAETVQSKLMEALHKAPAPKPETAGAKVERPAPAPEATNSNKSLTIKPPGPAAQPAQIARTEAAPVMPDKPSLKLPPTPPPPPMPVIGPKATPALPVLAPTPRPMAIEPPKPAPEPKPAPATVPVPAPPATRQVSAPAPVPPPSSIPTPPGQTATAVPAEAVAGHRNIWIAGLVLFGVVVSFTFLLLRRSRAAPGASLITRSIEREKKP